MDILPTVLHQLGLATPRSWNIDGHTLSHAKPPSAASARLRGHRLTARLTFGSAPKVRRVSFHLPARVDKLVTLRVNGDSARWTVLGKTVEVGVRPGRVRTISLTADIRGRVGSSLVVTMRGGKLSIPLR